MRVVETTPRYDDKMSIQPDTDRRTADRTTNRTPETHQLAAELGVDAALLREFVDHHPNPTAAIVLGWVNRQGDADPDRHADEVEAWLAERESTPTGSTTKDEQTLDEVLDDGRIGAEGWRQ